MKHAIIMLVYYNHDLIERTLKSFQKYRDNNEVDIYFIENPSKNSPLIKDLANTYNVNYHYICSENIGGILFEYFLRKMHFLLDKYDYISTTESDVVVEDGSIEEAISILNENNEIPVSYIQLNCDLEKYKNLPISHWVPKPTKYKTFYTGITGFQFITFRKNILYDFLNKLKNKEIIAPIACGCSDFYGLSDTNLGIYIENILRQKGGITNGKLDHIGWEKYIDINGNLNETGEYCLEKKKHVYRTRSNEILDNIERYKIKDITKLRCLFLDNLFPINKAQWRLVEIHSFIEKYDTDILVHFQEGYGGPDYEEMFERFHLSKYDILIFDPKYNFLNKYNDSEFNGLYFNNKLNPYSFLFRLKKFRGEEINCPHPPLSVYNFIYSIFIIPYLNFNERFGNFFPHEKQFIHLYPGGGSGCPPQIGDINVQKGTGRHGVSLSKVVNPNWKKSKWITTQNFLYEPLKQYNPDNIYHVYGGPFFYKETKLNRKTNFNNKINICFTSLGDIHQKGADIYIKIASMIDDKDVKFFSIGNCPNHKNIKHLNTMSQEKLSKFYRESIDIYINLTRSANGFPLGVEAAIEGCVLLTTDPYNSNVNNNFNIDNFLILNINDIGSIIQKIIDLKDINLRKKFSKHIQDKIYNLFNYENYMENGIFSIIEKNISEKEIYSRCRTGI